MTVFGKKKDNSGKKESSKKTSVDNTTKNVASSAIPSVSVETENVIVREPEPHSHPHHATFDPQPEDMTMRSGLSDVLRGNVSISAASLWSGVTNPDIRVQPHYHMEPPPQNHGKRRHRLSPMRTTRTKHSRVERDRSSNSSPNSCASMSPYNNGLSAAAVEPSSSPASVSPDEGSGYNSEDEYSARKDKELSEEEWVEREKRFEKKMQKKGLCIKQMGEDGACLFRAVADQVYGDQEMHDVVRKHCMDYIAANHDYYSPYVTEDFKHYVNRKRHDNCHGNHIEIQAMCEMYNRTIEVFCYSTEPINAFHGVHKTDNAPIRLSYHRGVHYNSVIDPYKATIGVGLGLPGNHPGLADKNILTEAARQSEEFQIEQAMLEDKLRATDWEATNEAIEEQVARESYLQWCKDNERRNRATRPPMASSSSATVTSSSLSEIRSPRSRHGGNLSPLGSPYRNEVKNSPSRHSPPPIPGTSKMPSPNPHSSSTNLHGTGCINSPVSDNPPGIIFPFLTSKFEIPTTVLEMNEWDEDEAGILAQVLAASQQEYFDKLKRSRESSTIPLSNGSSTPPHSSLSIGSLTDTSYSEENN